MINIVKLEDAKFVTHGGIFHADEVFATVVFETINGTIDLARGFDIPRINALCEKTNTPPIVYDIGYGPYDHHQRGGNGKRMLIDIPYASFGLVWRDFGEKCLEKMGCPEKLIDTVHSSVDCKLVCGIDATDNGRTLMADSMLMTISKAISAFNVTWDCDRESDERFIEACKFASSFFKMFVEREISTQKAADLVLASFRDSKNGYMVLSQYMPWKEHFFRLNAEETKDLYYVIFPSVRGGWNVQSVPVAPNSFESKLPFPEPWRGCPSETGIKGVNFVHMNGFLASTDSLETAKKLAELSIMSNKES